MTEDEIRREKKEREVRAAVAHVEEPYGDHRVVGAWYRGDQIADQLRALCRGCGTDILHAVLTADMGQEARWLRGKLESFPSSCEEARRLNLVREVMES